jgi:hypothetical protein
MPGLLRGIARTAVVAGTATAVSGRVRRRQDDKFAQRDADTAAKRDAAYDEETAPADEAPPAEPAPDATAERLDQLKTLGELKQSGVLTDAEFQAQKAKILAG